MATATHAPHLDIPATDDMDLHSDAGLDFDDGDIELDLDPAPPTDPQDDDDVSIKDAATDVGADAQADQDDYMQDNEGFGGDDTVLYDDEQNAGIALPQEAADRNTETPLQEDEDLIDYSDEEEETPPPRTASTYRPISSYTVPETNVDEVAAQAEDPESGVHNYGTKDEDEDAQNLYMDTYGHSSKPQAGDASDHSDGEDGGVRLQALEPQTNANEYQDDEDNANGLSETRTVTVDYEGNELWLFKQHDADDSGDWLLDDMSILHRSLSDLFQACRASLAENITRETELGFRFDHLHNMEIYEDNTACVAVSLGRLLDLYHTLNAQDGVSEPPSFYMCLLSRPRFATLLSDVAKHAEQGSGYSGLNAAVAAGETHFADTISGHTTEHEGADYEDGEGDGDQHEGTDSASNPEAEVEHAEREEQDYETGDSEEDEQHVAPPSHSDGSGIPEAVNTEEAISYDDADHDKNPDIGTESAQRHEASDETAEGYTEQPKAEEEHIDDDTIDYSDAEDDEDQPSKPSNALSPSSATVQGDDPANDRLQAQAMDPAQDMNEPGEEEAAADTAENDDAQSLVEEQLGHVDNTELYEQYDQQVYDQDDAFLEFQPVAYPDEPSFGEYTNNDYTGYEDQELDQQLQNDFISGAEFDYTDAGDSAIVPNNFTEGDDFLDLDNTAEWMPDEATLPVVPGEEQAIQDVTNAQEEGLNGVAEQPAAAAPSTTTIANPVAASSTDSKETSPQGQKRSIDEVGDSIDDALDLTGMFWTTQSYTRFTQTDCPPDMKRPRK